MNKKKITQSAKRVVLNADGEFIESEETSIFLLPQEPPYVKLYLDAIFYLKDIPKSHNPILLSILNRLPFANQEQSIAINASVKRKIAKELNCSISRINNALTDFVKGELLIREDVGLYSVNPYIFGRGEWKDIEKLRLEIDFDAHGTTIMGVVKKKSIKPETDDPNQVTLNLAKVGISHAEA